MAFAATATTSATAATAAAFLFANRKSLIFYHCCVSRKETQPTTPSYSFFNANSYTFHLTKERKSNLIGLQYIVVGGREDKKDFKLLSRTMFGGRRFLGDL